MNPRTFWLWTMLFGILLGTLVASIHGQTPKAEPSDNPPADDAPVVIDTKTMVQSLSLDISRIILVRVTDVTTIAPTDEATQSWVRASKGPVEDLAASIGVAPDRVKSNDIARMWEVSLGEVGENRSEIEKRIKEIATDARIRFVGPVLLDSRGDACIPLGSYTVRFRPDIHASSYQRIMDELDGGQIAIYSFTGAPTHVCVVPPTSDGFEAIRISNRVARDDRIVFAEPNMLVTVRAEVIPNDPGFGLQWGLNNTGQSGGFNDVDIDAPEAWDAVVTSRSATILILDDGVQLTHPDISIDTRFGRNFVTNPASGDGNPQTSLDNHGTAVAGVASARWNNMLGVSGVAPGTFVVSAKMYTQMAGGNQAPTAGIAEAIRYSLIVGAKVTNSSWTVGSTAQIGFAFQDTFAAGVVHFAASGNFNADFVSFPASLPEVVAVGACNRTRLVPGFSNRGFDLDFVAPGVDIYTTDRTGSAGYNAFGPNPDYVFGSPEDFVDDGTSYASPCAAGVAALLLRRNPRLTPQQIITRMQQTCVDITTYGVGFDNRSGYGIINAAAALGATASPRLGDANGDNAVNFSDVTAVLASFGTTNLDGDANYDGMVDFNDTITVLANYD